MFAVASSNFQCQLNLTRVTPLCFFALLSCRMLCFRLPPNFCQLASELKLNCSPFLAFTHHHCWFFGATFCFRFCFSHRFYRPPFDAPNFIHSFVAQARFIHRQHVFRNRNRKICPTRMSDLMDVFHAPHGSVKWLEPVSILHCIVGLPMCHAKHGLPSVWCNWTTGMNVFAN